VSLAFWPNMALDLSGDLCDLCRILANAARPPIDLLLLLLAPLIQNFMGQIAFVRPRTKAA